MPTSCAPLTSNSSTTPPPYAVTVSRLLIWTALAAAAALLPAQPLLAQSDIIRGRVTSVDSLPLENVQVTVTSIGGNVTRSARTDRGGRFTITFPGGEGDYMVTFTAIGFNPRRYELRRIADEEVLIADARLVPVTMLDAVTVAGQRARVPRGDAPEDVSGSEQALDVYAGAVAAADLGDLAAMAAALPGVHLTPGEEGDPSGFSVFGLGADQNSVTLNGMAFGGSSLPRDAMVSTSLATSPYDVSRGGFSGAQLGVRTRSGTNMRVSGMSLSADAPQMQWTDRSAQALGQEFSNLSLGGVLSGPIRFDRSFYNIAYQLGRRSSDFQHLLNTDPLGLRAAGVSADSATRLFDILSAEGVPFGAAGVPRGRLRDQGSVIGTFDFNPPSSAAGHAFNLSVNANWNRVDPVGGSPTDLPASTAERTQWRGGVQARHSGYLAPVFGALSETSLGMSASQSSTEPYLDLPAGRVRVASLFDDETGAVQTLGFGGAQAMRGSQRTRSAELNNQLSWFSLNNAHRWRLTTELRHERSSARQEPNSFGTFTFNSLSDLEANQPASFTRQLTPRYSDAEQLVAALSMGDSWRRTRDLQIQYGVRLDANRYATRPELNPEVEALFGARNDHVPNYVYVSPRIGFSWTYGAAPEVAGFMGASRRPRAVVRGGVGIFQGTPATSLIASALEQTGLPGAVQQITCTGAAVPAPDWSGYLSDPSLVPDRCADGTSGTPFSDPSPNVTLFASNYRAPSSVRSNLQWSGPILDNRFSLLVDATMSINRNQSGITDLNFVPDVRFTLGDEGDRPVYVQPASIVPGTGAIASRDSRLSPLYSRVLERRSDLESRGRQLRIGLGPTGFSTGFTWNVSYVLSAVREQVRGFGSTTGNPLLTEWSRGAMDTRHQFTYNLSYNFFDFVRVNWFGSVRSGAPFTPMIAGDVNGDGYANDRAFIFDPAESSDPQVAEGMQALLDNGSRGARECLSRQLGQLAARNSCEGPWSSTAVMSFSFNPLKVRLPQRATLSFQLSNPMAAADLLLNGSSGLRGWGQVPIVDQSLLHVRGFDAATQRYQYEVNPRFGSTNPAFSAVRSPVSLTALMRIDLGTPREQQLLTQQLDRGRRMPGNRIPEMMLRAMYGAGGIVNPMAAILRQQDSLGLSGAQADSIASLNRWYVIRLDSIWAPLATEFASLPDEYDRGDARSRYRSARRATVDLLSSLAPHVRGLLTAEQIRKLPASITSHLEPRFLASIRSGTNSFTGGGLAGGAPMPAGGGAQLGGGGGMITISRQAP